MLRSDRHSTLRHLHGSAAGNIITVLLLLGIVGLGAWLWLGKKSDDTAAPGASGTPTAQRAPGSAAAIRRPAVATSPSPMTTG